MAEVELAIVGAGPAGLSAAIEAAKAGARVTVIDENAKPGGQLFKQIHKFFGSEEHKAGMRGIDIGYQLLEQCRELEVDVLLNTIVWGMFDGNRALALKRNNESEKISVKKVILATGARENPLAFPGWTLPGVLGAGAAQTLVNLHRVLPGEKILMVGTGNVGLIVAYQLIQAGAEVVAALDILPEIGGWGVHASKIRRLGVPIVTPYTIKEAIGDDQVEGAVIGRVGPDYQIISGTERELKVDTICIAVGLTPMAELAWSIGCQFAYIPELGGWVPIHDNKMETTLSGVYVAGDVSGIEEASTALEEGRIAGIATAKSLGYLEKEEAEEMIKTRQKSLDSLRQGPFGGKKKIAKEKLRLLNSKQCRTQ